MASRGCGANRTAGGSDPDRQAFMAWRGQSLPLPVSHWRKGSVVRSWKAPRWSAERGPGRTGKVRALQARASRLARATEGKTSAPVGAPSTPRSGDDARGRKNREKETDALTQ